MIKDMEAIKDLIWKCGFYHMGNYRHPYIVRVKSEKEQKKREKITKVSANHVKHVRLHAREEQSLWVVSRGKAWSSLSSRNCLGNGERGKEVSS